MAKANLAKRFIASVIDSALIFIVGLIPAIGSIIGLIYLLTRDALVYEVTKKEEFRNRSLGKHLMGLKVARASGEGDIDLLTSVKRNLPLAIGGLVALIIAPILRTFASSAAQGMVTAGGTQVAPAAGLVGGMAVLATAAVGIIVTLLCGIPVVIECLTVLFNNEGRRLGDRFAGTHVAEV